MPTIWIKADTGSIFHFTTQIASWVGVYNTPDTAIPASCVSISNRDTVEIKTPTETLTMNLAQNGRTGECIQCGQCCSHKIKDFPAKDKKCGYEQIGKHHVCKYLVEYPEKGGIGKPGGTSCRIYSKLLEIGNKTCVLYPESIEDITVSMTACAMRFA
jgi:hypothetical protein